jgi:hypothetical protein
MATNTLSVGATAQSDVQLQESDRQRLDGIVQKMVANKESDGNIRWVVNDFKQKYGKKPQTLLQKAGGVAGKGLKLASKLVPKMAFGPIGDLVTPEGREAARGAIGSTVQSLAKPVVSAASGISGLAGMQIVPKGGVNIPMFGKVTPYETPQGAAATGLTQTMGRQVSPEQVQQTKQTQFSRSLNDLMTGATSYLEVGAPGLGKLAKRPLTFVAEKLYQSALKPSTKLAPDVVKNVIKTGLEERVWLTEGGVERVASKIDSMEGRLGDAIDKAKEAGLTINTKGMQEYVNQVKDFFKYDVDVEAGKAAVKELDGLVKNFTKQYGKEMPLEVAQKIKVSTGQQLAKYYDRMTSVGVEGRKQMTRFLKDKIVEKAPIVGDINSRLKNLYELDKVLSSATNRIGNLNLLGLGSKILSAGGIASKSKLATALGIATSLIRPSGKSGLAIGLNELAKGGSAISQVARPAITGALNMLLNKNGR